ncbi:MFS transporter OS=Streptomyces tendae OX=1932 GN=GUR47_11155 PE=4 SV=1 [Streptomyces tendae]
MQRPALDSLWPRIVAHDHMPAAASLNSLRWTVGGVAGPAVAGVVVAYAGLGWAYAADVATFVVSLLLVVRIAASPASHEAAKPSLRAIAEGARYAWRRKELLGTYAVDLAAMFLAMPLAVLPESFADELDAVVARPDVHGRTGQGDAGEPDQRLGATPIPAARATWCWAALWGLAIAAAGLMSNVWLVLLFLTLAGGCDMVSGIFRAAMWNQTIPDELRGRLAGIELLSYSVGPTLGQVRTGGFAAWLGVRASVWCGQAGRGRAAGPVPAEADNSRRRQRARGAAA